MFAKVKSSETLNFGVSNKAFSTSLYERNETRTRCKVTKDSKDLCKRDTFAFSINIKYAVLRRFSSFMVVTDFDGIRRKRIGV